MFLKVQEKCIIKHKAYLLTTAMPSKLKMYVSDIVAKVYFSIARFEIQLQLKFVVLMMQINY